MQRQCFLTSTIWVALPQLKSLNTICNICFLINSYFLPTGYFSLTLKPKWQWHSGCASYCFHIKINTNPSLVHAQSKAQIKRIKDQAEPLKIKLWTLSTLFLQGLFCLFLWTTETKYMLIGWLGVSSHWHDRGTSQAQIHGKESEQVTHTASLPFASGGSPNWNLPRSSLEFCSLSV